MNVGRDPMGVPDGALLARALSVKNADQTATVEINTLPTLVNVARDLTIGVGDMLLVHRVDAAWFASCRVFAAATEEQPAIGDLPDPNATAVTETLTVLPVYTGSYRSGTWRPDTSEVIQGVRGGYGNSTGAAFYGDKPGSLAEAVITGARVELTRADSGTVGAIAPTLWLVTETEQPAGAPTLTLSTPGPALERGASTTFSLPTSWGQALADGTAGGLAVYEADGDPWLTYPGRAELASAWTLAIDWTR